MLKAVFILLFIASPALADVFPELTRDGSRAQTLLDSVARKAANGTIRGMDLLCPNYRAFNGDRTKRSLVWSQIIAASRSPAEEVLQRVDSQMSVQGLIRAGSAVAQVNRYCRGLPNPYGVPAEVRPEAIYVVGPYSNNRVYKLYEKGDLAMWPEGETGTRLGKGFGVR